MLQLNDKLKLIAEGYTIEDINSNQVTLPTLVSDGTAPHDEISMMLEAVNSDISLIQESTSEYLQESVLGTLVEKIKKFFQWIGQKIANMIKWIKGKFAKKAEEVEQTIAEVKEKADSGELKETIEAIKTGDEEKYKEVKKKHRSVKKMKIHPKSIKVHSNKPPVAEPEPTPATHEPEPPVTHQSDDSHTENIKMPSKSILKLTVREKIYDNKVPDITEMAQTVAKIINTSLPNVENFRSAIIRGTSAGKLNSETSIMDVLANLASGNKVQHVKDLEKYVLGK